MRSRRAGLATVATVVAAVLFSGVQHSIRLCRVGDHPAQTVASPAGCSQHEAPAAPSEGSRDERPPSCCDQTALLVSLPSLKGTALAKLVPWPFFDVGATTALARDRAAAATSLSIDDCTRRSGPFPGRRVHLALCTIVA
jgi:hypothetical protein